MNLVIPALALVLLTALKACNATAQPEGEATAKAEGLQRCDSLESTVKVMAHTGDEGFTFFKAHCSFLTGIDLAYISKRMKVDGQDYVCVRAPKETACRWAWNSHNV